MIAHCTTCEAPLVLPVALPGYADDRRCLACVTASQDDLPTDPPTTTESDFDAAWALLGLS